MKRLVTTLLCATAVVATSLAAATLLPDPPVDCRSCAAWNRPQTPFHVFGNTYYVGTAELASLLLVSDRGLVLLDGALPQSAPLIDASIRRLGFRTEDVRLILNSHAHFDHAGGIAALARASGATVLASAPGAAALERGGPTPDDPQFGFGHQANAFPAVAGVRRVADGEVVRLGNLAITAHRTPGHTPGGTTWTWRSCAGGRCLDLVYADSLTAVSAPGFRFAGGAGTPGRVVAFRRSIEAIAALPCDILLVPHPALLHLDEKLARRERDPASNPFIDPGGCRAYAARAEKGLDRRVREEHEGRDFRSSPPPGRSPRR